MATFAARKLADIAENTANILAIELLAAAQGVDLRAPHRTSGALQRVMDLLREHVPHYDLDRYFAPDIACIARLVVGGAVAQACPLSFDSEALA
jgi:histidine ammonia-lyase